jgi:hypothetical protein
MHWYIVASTSWRWVNAKLSVLIFKHVCHANRKPAVNAAQPDPTFDGAMHNSWTHLQLGNSLFKLTVHKHHNGSTNAGCQRTPVETLFVYIACKFCAAYILASVPMQIWITYIIGRWGAAPGARHPRYATDNTHAPISSVIKKCQTKSAAEQGQATFTSRLDTQLNIAYNNFHVHAALLTVTSKVTLLPFINVCMITVIFYIYRLLPAVCNYIPQRNGCIIKITILNNFQFV